MQDAWQLELLQPTAFARTDDARAQERLYQLCRRVAASVCRASRADDERDDMAQFLAVQLLEKGHLIRNRAPPAVRCWLWETGRRELWRRQREAQRYAFSLDDAPLSDRPDPNATDAEWELLTAAEQRAVERFLADEVSEKQLVVAAVLLTNPDATQQELAAALGISQPCVGRRLARFRVACRAFLGNVNNSLGARALLRALESYRGD
jgi:DNA-directed RNA polymerase specialized sigma24 family protein